MTQQFLTKFNLTRVTIVANGESVDLLPESITSIEIFESVCQPGITGNISFADYQGLKEIGKICAGDDIIIKYSTQDSEEISLKFKINASFDDTFAPESTYVIVNLGFCSDWLIEALGRRVSKFWKDKYIHEIVNDLIIECGALPGHIENTKQKLENFVSPLWTPIHTIRHLSSFAKNVDNEGGYVLFTDYKTGLVHFCTVSYMIKENFGTYESFIYRPGNVQYEGAVNQLTFEQNFDLTRFLNAGYGKIRNYGFWYDKKKEIETEDDIKQYKTKHIAEKFPMDPKYLTEEKYWQNKFVKIYPRRANAIDSQEDLDDVVNGELYTRYTYLFTDMFKVNISANGESKRRAGQIATLEFPSQKDRDNTRENDKRHQGKYLIRDVKHAMMRDGMYEQFITLVNDGYFIMDRPDVEKWE